MIKIDKNFKCECGGKMFKGEMTTNCSHDIYVEIVEDYVEIEYDLDFVDSYNDFTIKCEDCGKEYSDFDSEIEV